MRAGIAAPQPATLQHTAGSRAFLKDTAWCSRHTHRALMFEVFALNRCTCQRSWLRSGVAPAPCRLSREPALIEIEGALARRGAIKKPDRICSPAPSRVAVLTATV